MERRADIEISSRLEASPEKVWSWVVTAEGVNDEMRPWLRMTVPGGDFDLSSVEPGKPIGRSWVLLLGLIPIDYDEINLEEIDEGSRFVERSRMLSQRAWEHVRTIRPLEDGGDLITDAVAWEPRLPIPGVAMKPLFRAIFGHRHRRLRRRFGGAPARGPDDG